MGFFLYKISVRVFGSQNNLFRRYFDFSVVNLICYKRQEKIVYHPVIVLCFPYLLCDKFYIKIQISFRLIIFLNTFL